MFFSCVCIFKMLSFSSHRRATACSVSFRQLKNNSSFFLLQQRLDWFSWANVFSHTRFKAKECRQALNTGKAANVCILETVGEQSQKNANVYEKLNALEHQAEICNRVSLVIPHERHKTTGKLLALEQHTTDGVESNTAQSNVFLNNVVNIAVKSWVLRTSFCRRQLFFFPSPVRSVNSFIPDIRGGGKILKESNRVKWGSCLCPWLLSRSECACVWSVKVIGASERLKIPVTLEFKLCVNPPRGPVISCFTRHYVLNVR